MLSHADSLLSSELRSLRSAMKEFVATYKQQETLKPTVIREFYHMNKNKTRKRWTRKTKITSKVPYIKKKTYPMVSR